MEIIDFLFADTQLLTTGTLIVLIALLVGNILADKFRKYAIIEAGNAVSLMDDKDLIILDVREQKERKKGYIKGDTHIPLASVSDKLATLDKHKKVLVYCLSGRRSAHISGLLSRNGFDQVYNLKGGINAWKKANLPIQK